MILCPCTCFRVGREYYLLAPWTTRNTILYYFVSMSFHITVAGQIHWWCLTTCTYSPPHTMLTVTIILYGVTVFSSHCPLNSPYSPLRRSRLVVFGVCRPVPRLLTCKDNKFMVVLGIGTHPAPCSHRYYTHFILTQRIVLYL